ncbi:DNA adenine methylase [Bifidobacterium longum subsp. infantis]|nr:DNA adenine methylase [Bifidobacterium longum]QUF86149.1 DNA adenine methylase [Bifidobacterium longum subsp. infantis]
MPTTYTPIRYPGGKTKIYPEIKAIMEKNCLSDLPYAEVFAGGAGLAVKLLIKGDVPSIIINDYDRAVYCIWNAIVNNGEDMCKFVSEVPLNIDTWLHCREVYRSRDAVDDYELAKAAFYLNRTNVSGILGVVSLVDKHRMAALRWMRASTEKRSVEKLEISLRLRVQFVSLALMRRSLSLKNYKIQTCLLTSIRHTFKKGLICTEVPLMKRSIEPWPIWLRNVRANGLSHTMPTHS